MMKNCQVDPLLRVIPGSFVHLLILLTLATGILLSKKTAKETNPRTGKKTVLCAVSFCLESLMRKAKEASLISDVQVTSKNQTFQRANTSPEVSSPANSIHFALMLPPPRDLEFPSGLLPQE